MENVLDNIKEKQKAESENYLFALKEIYNCSKNGHWIWYIFPQNIYSSKNQYRIYNEKTLIAYLNNDILMKRLIKITNLAIKCLKSGIEMEKLFIAKPEADVKKFRFSMSLFFLGSLIIDSDYKYIFAEALYYSKNVIDESIYNTDLYKYKSKEIYYSISDEQKYDDDYTNINSIDINYYLAFKNSGTESKSFNNTEDNIKKYKYYNKLIDDNIYIIENFKKYPPLNDYILNNNVSDIIDKDNDDYSIKISINNDNKIVTYNSKKLNEYEKSNEINFSKAKIYELEDNKNLKLIKTINSKSDLQEYTYNYYT